MTFRELLWAVKGRQEHDWAIAANIMALTANCNRSKGQKAYSPRDFNPMRKDEKPKHKANPAVIISLLFGRHDLASQCDHGSN